jgi:hypothetical protein
MRIGISDSVILNRVNDSPVRPVIFAFRDPARLNPQSEISIPLVVPPSHNALRFL